MRKQTTPQQGVKQVEIALNLVVALAEARGPLQLGELARMTGLPTAKAHRFIVSLCRTTFVEQLPDGRYDLGRAAIQTGLAAQSRLDEFRLADDALHQLREKCHLPVALMTWGTHGPIVVRKLDVEAPIIASARIGATVSALNSSAGRLFLAFLPDGVVEPILKAEREAGVHPTLGGRRLGKREFDALVREIRDKRFAHVRGDFLSGFDALSAPVFDAQGTMIMAIAVLGASGSIDARPASNHLQSIVKIAAELSARIGHR